MGDPSFDYYKQLTQEVRIWLDGPGRDFPYNHFISQAPDLFHLLTSLARKSSVSDIDRDRLIGAIIYFVTPLDVLPERVAGGAGFVDDVALAAYVLKTLTPASANGALTDTWQGEGDVLVLIDEILASAEAMCGTRSWAKITAKVESW